ncbi:glutamate racemase, partial [Lactobacillus crispatus]
TDTVVLACTHYPLLLDRLAALAPWPVDWIDPAPAIARRTADLMSKVSRGDGAAPAQFIFTSGAAPSPTLARALEPYFGQTAFA